RRRPHHLQPDPDARPPRAAGLKQLAAYNMGLPTQLHHPAWGMRKRRDGIASDSIERSCRAGLEQRERGAGMTTSAESPLQTSQADATQAGREQPADVLVVFGITGDLARVMTFRSLYRLERRGLLHCPIVGVAVDDWTVDHLRKHARACIEATGEPVDAAIFDRLSDRLSYVQGSFDDSSTFDRVADAIKGAELPACYLEIPPFLFG